MKNFVRTTLLAATWRAFFFWRAFATAVPNPPLPAQILLSASEAGTIRLPGSKKTSPTTGNRRQSDFYEGIKDCADRGD